jgi:dGTPase
MRQGRHPSTTYVPPADPWSGFPRILHQHLYSHEQKLEMTRKVQTVLQDLFETFMTDVNRMPGEFATAAEHGDDAARARVVADYIAGMTDRYAFAEHKRISG